MNEGVPHRAYGTIWNMFLLDGATRISVLWKQLSSGVFKSDEHPCDVLYIVGGLNRQLRVISGT